MPDSCNVEVLSLKEKSVRLERNFFLKSIIVFAQNHIDFKICFANSSRDPAFVTCKKYENNNIF